MNLSKFKEQSLKEAFKSAFATFENKVNSIKGFLTDEQLQKVSDAKVIGDSIQARLESTSDEDLKPSIKRFTREVTAAFQSDISSLELREQIKKNQNDNTKEIGARTIGEGKTILSKYPDYNNNLDAPKTRSPLDPSRVAEHIARDMECYRYSSIQEAYDGYTNEDKHNAVWPYASATQKCTLAKILTAWGFKVDYDKWEKQAAKDHQELLKANKDLGKGERKPEDSKINVKRGELEVKADDQYGRKPAPTPAKDNKYFNKCGKTTTWKDGKCQDCPVAPSKPTMSILDKFITEDELKAEAVSKDARDFISNKVKKLRDEGYEQDQAVAIAYDYAHKSKFHIPKRKAKSMREECELDVLKEKAFKILEAEEKKEEPKEENKNSEDYCAGCGRELDGGKCPKCSPSTFDSQGKKNAQYDPQAGIAADPSQQHNPAMKPEMSKMGMGYACGNQGCGYSQSFEKQGEYNCPKCGGKMVYGGDMAGTGTGGAAGSGNMMPSPMTNPTQTNPMPAAYGKDGATQYMAMIQKAADKNLSLDRDCVKELGISYYKNMDRMNMKSVRARYLIKWLQNEKIQSNG